MNYSMLSDEQLLRKCEKYNKDFLVAGDSVTGDAEIDLLYNGRHLRLAFDGFFMLFSNKIVLLNEKEYIYPATDFELKILTYNEKKNNSCFMPIKYLVRHKTNKDLYQVNITNEFGVTVTEDHSLMTYINTKDRRKGDISIFDETKPTDLLGKSLILNNLVPNHHRIVYTEFTEIHYNLLGLMFADGNIEHRCMSLSCGKNDIDEIIDKVIKPLVDIGDISSYKIRKNGHDLRIYGKSIRAFCGDICERNKISHTLGNMFLLPESKIKAFLSGVFTGDRHSGKSNIRMSNIHKENIKELSMLLRYCGVASTYFKDNTENSYNGVMSGTYNYVIVVKSDFSDIGFILNRKNKIDYNNSKRRKFFKKNNYNFSLSPVKEVIKLEKSENYVYDVEVEETHTFFANDILLHNTDSVYITLEDIVKIQFGKNPPDDITVVDFLDKFAKDKIEPYINDSYQRLADYMGAHEQKMKMSREVIAKSGIWRKKKNYALDVYDNEGVRYDKPKLKIMGMESVRSSTPEICRKAFEECVKIILRYDEESLQTFIKDFKKEFFEMSVEEIGKNSACNDIEKWEIEDENGFMSRTPFHVKCAITYNRLIDKFNLSGSYRKIVSGDKIKLLYLKPENPAFNNGIAFPDILPDEFELNEYIDYNEQYFRTFLKPIETLTIIVGWSAERRATLF